MLSERNRSLSGKVIFDCTQVFDEDVAGLAHTILIRQRAREAAATGGHGCIASHRLQKLRDAWGLEMSWQDFACHCNHGLREVARRAAVSAPAAYRHFRDEEALLAALAKKVLMMSLSR